MNYMIIGTTVGFIMGLTGAGGALVSIPLFIHLLNVSLKEASVLSLLAVLLGTGVNLSRGLKNVDVKTVAALTIFGGISSALTLSIKEKVPDYAVALLLTFIGAYSLWTVWRSKVRLSTLSKVHPGMLKLIVIGLGLGMITTLTGLGGGVVLVPLMMHFFGRSYDESMPTSLFTIFMVTLISFTLQAEITLSLIRPEEMVALAAGSLLSFFSLDHLLKKLSAGKIIMTRKMVFSAVSIYAIATVLQKTI